MDFLSVFIFLKDVKFDFVCDGEWYFIAFVVNSVNFMILYVDLMSDVKVIVIDDMIYMCDEIWLLSVFELMMDVILFGAVDFEFDDVRVYIGVIREVMFIDIVRCGYYKCCVFC